MQVGGGGCHGAAGTRIRGLPLELAMSAMPGRRLRRRAGRCRQRRPERVAQDEHEKIAGVDAQSRRLRSIRQQVAVARAAVGLQRCAHRQLQAQHAIPAAQFLGFGNRAARQCPGARFRAGRCVRAHADAGQEHAQGQAEHDQRGSHRGQETGAPKCVHRSTGRDHQVRTHLHREAHGACSGLHRRGKAPRARSRAPERIPASRRGAASPGADQGAPTH